MQMSLKGDLKDRGVGRRRPRGQGACYTVLFLASNLSLFLQLRNTQGAFRNEILISFPSFNPFHHQQMSATDRMGGTL